MEVKATGEGVPYNINLKKMQKNNVSPVFESAKLSFPVFNLSFSVQNYISVNEWKTGKFLIWINDMSVFLTEYFTIW
ncbi:MAG: hypothetical protein LBK58_04390 [Prevotellaceae bacterium]|nr:hypothetical protein [Prevotellaceae bacterium]